MAHLDIRPRDETTVRPSEIFLEMASILGIFLIVFVVAGVLIFVIDMAGDLYDEYKKIREQEQENHEHQ